MTQNPYTLTFPQAFDGIPRVSVTALGATAAFATADNVAASGMDVYLFNLSGEKISGSVNWTAEGV